MDSNKTFSTNHYGGELEIITQILKTALLQLYFPKSIQRSYDYINI